MKILITGAKGFIGKNLVCELRNRGYNDLYLFDTDTDAELLDEYTKDCDFVFHLAGVNRPKENDEFMKGNFGFISILLDCLIKNNNKCPILITSSIQAALNNPYGISKKAGEDLIFEYGRNQCAKIYVYRMTNVFGKWSRPNYNSAIATFCYNISRDLEIKVNDPEVVMNLIYIDDLVDEFIRALEGKATLGEDNFHKIPVFHTIKLGDIVKLLYSFKESRSNLEIPNMGDPVVKKLYSTYISFLPEDKFAYDLKMNVDNRGSFTEFLKAEGYGQVSVNISKPHIVKGNHWHNTKNEKFLVVSGKGVIRFKEAEGDKVIEYFVDGNNLKVVDIPCGYSHNIENLGDTDMVTIMWANEKFNKDKPDTYILKI